ncbi:MAG: sulfotransferase [Steroidobacteraceae bacterium]
MQRFIVGTGRCGSTLLSSLIAEHPEVLSLSEFIGGMTSVKRFTTVDVAGDELASILRGDQELSNLWVSRGFTIEETLLKHQDMAGLQPNFRASNFLHAAIPALDPHNPQALFEEIMQWAHEQSPGPMARHLPTLFDWLTQRLGKKLWIERTGASMEFFGELRRTFPHAHYLHIHRDGAEASLSMRQHAHFIQLVSFNMHAPTRAELEQAVDASLPYDADPIVRRFRNPPALEHFGEHWTYSMVRGYREFPFVDRDHYCEIRFENLLARPYETLEQVAEFFELPAAGNWIERAAAKVRSDVQRRADRLPAQERARLTRACFLGQILSGREGGDLPAAEASRSLLDIYARG